jgi:hypothetical protein
MGWLVTKVGAVVLLVVIFCAVVLLVAIFCAVVPLVVKFCVVLLSMLSMPMGVAERVLLAETLSSAESLLAIQGVL